MRRSVLGPRNVPCDGYVVIQGAHPPGRERIDECLASYASPSVVTEARDADGSESSSDERGDSRTDVPDVPPPVSGGFSAVPRTRARDSITSLDRTFIVSFSQTA